jgi:pyroglutamyl-peptidase I
MLFSIFNSNGDIMKKVLITGFGPFGKHTDNPSLKAVNLLPSQFDSLEIIKAELPVSFEKAFATLKNLIETHKPSIVICAGLAANREKISVERIAINVNDCTIQDNDGTKFSDDIIDYAAPSSWFSNLPCTQIVKKLNEANLPAEVSNSAGTFVCNNVFFNLMSHINYTSPDIKGGFIHLPPLTTKLDDRSLWTLESLRDTLTIAIQTCDSTIHSSMYTRNRLSVTPYNPDWPNQFAAIKENLIKGLGRLALSIDHIGSTSVPNLAAKDVIDIQITVKELSKPLLEAMNSMGYTKSEVATSDHVPANMDPNPEKWKKWFFRPPTGQRGTNTHVRIMGNPNQMYPLLFRDYLRANPDTAKSYGELKLRLAANIANPKTYPDVKDPAVDLIFFPALEWAKKINWRQ